MRAAAQTRLRAHLGPMLEHTDGAILSELRCHDCARTALVYPDHRVIYDFPSGYVERYDRATDPDEQHNVDDTGTGHSQAFRRRLQGYLRVRGTGHAATEPRR